MQNHYVCRNIYVRNMNVFFSQIGKSKNIFKQMIYLSLSLYCFHCGQQEQRQEIKEAWPKQFHHSRRLGQWQPNNKTRDSLNHLQNASL